MMGVAGVMVGEEEEKRQHVIRGNRTPSLRLARFPLPPPLPQDFPIVGGQLCNEMLLRPLLPYCCSRSAHEVSEYNM